jgi:hypothetical protein
MVRWEKGLRLEKNVAAQKELTEMQKKRQQKQRDLSKTK